MSSRSRAAKRKVHKHVAPTRVAEMLGVVGHSYTPNSESSEENEETYARARAVEYSPETLAGVAALLDSNANDPYLRRLRAEKAYGGLFARAVERGDFQTARAVREHSRREHSKESQAAAEALLDDSVLEKAGFWHIPTVSFGNASRALIVGEHGNRSYLVKTKVDELGLALAGIIIPDNFVVEGQKERTRTMLHYMADAYDMHEDAAREFLRAGLVGDADRQIREIPPEAYPEKPVRARAAQLQEEFDAFNESKARHLARTWQPANAVLPQGAGWLQQQFLPFFGGESIYRPPKAGRPRLVSPPPQE